MFSLPGSSCGSGWLRLRAGAAPTGRREIAAPAALPDSFRDGAGVSEEEVGNQLPPTAAVLGALTDAPGGVYCRCAK